MREHGHRAIARALLLATVLLGTAAPALALELAELMKLLAQRGSGEARYTEQRWVAGLEQPLRSTGTLSFQAPDRLARTTEQPRAETFVVEGNRVTMERGGRKRQMMLDTVPELAAFVAALRGTLTGDTASLQQYFQATVAGTAARWSITLKPLEPQLAQVLRQVKLDGQRSELRQLELQLADGDRSLMVIEPQTAPAKAP